MPYNLTQKEFDALLKTDAVSRYEHTIKRMADWSEVWSLRNSDGWVLSSDGDAEVGVPIWPHPRYAESCAAGNWSDTVPSMITIDDWLDKWIPGLIKDNRSISVFPVCGESNSKGVTVSPQRLREDLQAQLGLLE